MGDAGRSPRLPSSGGRSPPARTGRQQPAVGQVVDGRQQLLGRQVAGHAEQHEHARAGQPRDPPVSRIAQRVRDHVVLPPAAISRLMVSSSSFQEAANFSHALLLQHLDDVVVVHAERLELREHLAATRHRCRLIASPCSWAWSAVACSVASGIVFTVPGRGQFGHVHRVGEGRVLGAGRRPQRTLRPGAAGGQRLPARGRGLLLEQLVREPRVGERGLAAQRLRLWRAELVEPAVDLGVDPADEERGY